MNPINPRRWVLILGTIVAIGPMSIDLYLPTLPTLQAHFGTDAGTVQYTLASYFVGLAIGQVAYGPIADRFGRRTPLLVGLGLYVAASLACAFAPTIHALIAARFVQAIGGCSGMIIARAMVRDRHEGADMARVLSALVLVMGIAPILAPLAGAQILALSGWRAVFVTLALFGLLCWGAAWGGLPETIVRRSEPIRMRGVASAYAQLLRHRRFMGYTLAGGVASAGMFAYITGAPFVFIDVFGVAPERFGLFFGANAAGLIVASQLNRWLLLRMRAERIVRAALTTFAVSSLVLLAAVATRTGGVWGVALPLFVCLGSLGFSFPNATAAAMAPFGDRAGLAAALMGTLQFTAAAIAGAAVGQLNDGTALPMALVIAGCGLTAVILLRALVPAPRNDPSMRA